MNIVYTVNGEGMGHASRSSVVIEHLLKKGHTLTILSSGEKAVSYLRQKFGNVVRVTGFHLVYYNNRVKRVRTLAHALGNLNHVGREVVSLRRTLKSFNPEVVITDFDFHGELVSRLFRIPVISIDNIQIITQAAFSVALEDLVDYEFSYLIAKMMVPHADYYFITAFADLDHRRPEMSHRVFFIPPLLREQVLRAKPTIGDHILVYQTSDSYRQRLFNVLAQSPERFIVYNAKLRVQPKNVVCKDFSENEFINDLASAKAVITNGGFNVIAESLYFRKPILSIPIRHQFEQLLNAQLLQEQRLGFMVHHLSKTSLVGFLQRLDSFRTASRKLVFSTGGVFDKLDEVLSIVKAKS